MATDLERVRPALQSPLISLASAVGIAFASLCPELDVASQGNTVDEAVELFLECAPAEEMQRRYRSQVFVTRFEAAYA